MKNYSGLVRGRSHTQQLSPAILLGLTQQTGLLENWLEVLPMYFQHKVDIAQAVENI